MAGDIRWEGTGDRLLSLDEGQASGNRVPRWKRGGVVVVMVVWLRWRGWRFVVVLMVVWRCGFGAGDCGEGGCCNGGVVVVVGPK